MTDPGTIALAAVALAVAGCACLVGALSVGSAGRHRPADALAGAWLALSGAAVWVGLFAHPALALAIAIACAVPAVRHR